MHTLIANYQIRACTMCGAAGTRTQDRRIMSPLLCGSQGSGGVLAWGSVPARPPVHGSELEPELQPLPCPRLGRWARGTGGAWVAAVAVTHAHTAADAAGKSTAVGAFDPGWERFVGIEQCTPSGACRTASAHPVAVRDFALHGGSAADDQHGRTVRSWPLLVLALPAAVAVWSG
jgi:hypothetical protein